MAELEPIVLIGDWQYQVIYGQLIPIDQQADAIIRLEPQLHSLLNYFLRHPHKVLTKDILLAQVWPKDGGSDAAVMRAVGALRKLLGDDVKASRYIATVPKKGYRWLAVITSASLLADTDAEITAHSDAEIAGTVSSGTNLATETTLFSKRRTDYAWSWRFVLLSTLTLLISSAVFAFILSLYTTDPLLKLPDTITPISALNGEEYHPILNAEQTQVIFQHKKLGESHFTWVQQDLQSRRAFFLPQQYLALSAAQWVNNQSIIFSGQTEQLACGIYQQQLYPVAAAPHLLWNCNKLQPQGVVQWQQQWLWLDTSKDNNDLQLWSGQQPQAAKLLASYDYNWQQISAILLQQDALLVLAHETAANSVLLKIDLLTMSISLLARFNSKITDMAWWDNTKLLLSRFNQNLKVYDLKAKTEQDLGPLSRTLVQASRYPGQVLATQYLNYITDIHQVSGSSRHSIQLLPWHMSNRSEYLYAEQQSVQAFVSERSGVSQVWLRQGSGQIVQLTDFKQQQQLQQLFWHQQQLMLVANNTLYHLDTKSGALQLAEYQVANVGRYASCQQQLVWTERTNNGWQLTTLTEQGPVQLYQDVLDVRCAGKQQLIVQGVDDGQLTLLSLAGHQVQLTQTLPIEIDWRNVTSEQWFVDSSGIYWLNPNQRRLQSYLWQDQIVHDEIGFKETWPLAIYSNGNGLGYLVQARPFDSDIVWLQHRR